MFNVNNSNSNESFFQDVSNDPLFKSLREAILKQREKEITNPIYSIGETVKLKFTNIYGIISNIQKHPNDIGNVYTILWNYGINSTVTKEAIIRVYFGMQ